ncbi:MAG: mechanosensitive ion channel [Desulfobacterales bacterium]
MAEQSKLQAEIELYELQMTSQDILLSVMTAERDLASRYVTKRKAFIKTWQDQVQKRRQHEALQAREAAEKAKTKAPEMPIVLKKEFDINIELGEALEELIRDEAEVTKRIERMQTQLKKLKEDYALSRQRVDTMVLTDAIGLALRAQRQALPDSDQYRLESAKRLKKMSEIREAQIELDHKRLDLTNLDSELDRIIGSLGSLPGDKLSQLKSDVRKLLIDRRVLVEKLQNGYLRYLGDLQSLEYTEQQLTVGAEAFAEFLDRHLLWIRSSKPLGFEDLNRFPIAIGWMLAPDNWWGLISDKLASFKHDTGLWILVLLMTGFLLGRRRWARKDMARVAGLVSKHRNDSFTLTLWTFALTIYLAAGWPFLMALWGLLLLNLPQLNVFTRAVSNGLVYTAEMLAALRFFYYLIKDKGLGHIHFEWPEAARQTMQRNLRWLIPLAAIAEFVVSAMAATREIKYSDSLSKLALMVQGMAVSICIAKSLQFSGGIVAHLLKYHKSDLLTRLRFVWYPLAVGLPLFAVVLAALGYCYSALEVRNLICMTALLLMSLMVLNHLTLRWLQLTRRKIALKEARKKRQLDREKLDRQKAEEGSIDTQAGTLLIQEPEVGLTQIDEQTRTLLRTAVFILLLTGLWLIWEPVFPAFGILQEINLWSYNSMVDGAAKAIPITLADVVLAILITVITFISAKNLPGLLEITLLNRIPMDPGARYAFIRISRYAITAIGIVLAINTIGLQWAKLQWLIAALGVGLGFGLQEIVANFICGLIVLFERPFRVGDTVTVGETSGTVSRIRIRATTITDWDRRELIVPNKEFITGKLINWSLSDPVLRIKIPVGIAYGSDTDLAEALLLNAARENPMVLEEPAPSAIFTGFGDNSLNFEVRAFINNINNWYPMVNRLNRQINNEFKKAGITIAFPQRDVHLDTSNPLEIRVVSGTA